MVVSLLYGSGLRLSECVRLRVQDIDFSYSQIWVRNSKGAKDRVSILPEILHDDLKQHLRKVKKLHSKDLARGCGAVILPYALELKYPGEGKKLRWQYVFPSEIRRKDPRSGKKQRYHISGSTIHKAIKKQLIKPLLPKRFPAIHFATVSLLIYWKTATISEQFRSY